jgi:hypothetical protein
MAVVALVGLVRRRKRKADIQDHPTADAGAQTGAAVLPTPAPEAKAEGSGSPILRVAAGVLALLFAGVPAFMAIHGRIGLADLAAMGVFAFMFGWYAVRGRKGLPRCLQTGRLP